MTVKTYAITLAQVAELSDAIALLDWIKNRVPDESPDKWEAAVKVPRCHALLADVLGADEQTVYGPEEQEAAA